MLPSVRPNSAPSIPTRLSGAVTTYVSTSGVQHSVQISMIKLEQCLNVSCLVLDRCALRSSTNNVFGKIRSTDPWVLKIFFQEVRKVSFLPSLQYIKPLITLLATTYKLCSFQDWNKLSIYHFEVKNISYSSCFCELCTRMSCWYSVFEEFMNKNFIFSGRGQHSTLSFLLIFCADVFDFFWRKRSKV